MAYKKRKINEDELTYSDNVGISWEELFETGKFADSEIDLFFM